MSQRNGHTSDGSAPLRDVRSQTLERLAGTVVPVRCRDGSVEEVLVGKLSVDQLVALGHLSDRIRRALSVEQVAQIKTAAEVGGNEAVEIGFDLLLAVLDAETIGSLFGLLIDKPTEWCRRELGIVDMVTIFDAVLAENSWSEVAAVFTRARKRLARSPAPPQG
jgi:hypothetical protein